MSREATIGPRNCPGADTRRRGEVGDDDAQPGVGQPTDPSERGGRRDMRGDAQRRDRDAAAFQLGGDAGTPQFFGAAPPPGSGVHEYRITVTPLDVARCGVDATASAALLGFTIAPHTLARAVITCPTPAPALR